MYSHTKQRVSLQDCRVILDIAFRCSRSKFVSHSAAFSTVCKSNVESYATGRSAVPDRMSSHTRHCFPPFLVECRVTLDRLSDLLGRMSRQTRQRFPFQVELRVIIKSAYRCFRSNVESQSKAFFAVASRLSSHWTAHPAVRGRMSSHSTALLLLQVECRVTQDSAYRPSRFNVESQSTAFSDLPVRMSNYSTELSAVPGRMFSHTRQRFLLFQCECRVCTALNALPCRMSSHIRQRFPTFQFEC